MGHGGKREGAGRPPGSGWKPKIRDLKNTVAEAMQNIVDSDKNPLIVLVDMVADENRPPELRAQIGLGLMPYLFPRLSETRVQSQTTVTHVSAGELLDRIAEKMARVATRPPVIDGVPISPVGGSTLRQDAAENREKS